MVKILLSSAATAAALLNPSFGAAQEIKTNAIDAELRDQLDFRADAFEQCLAETECTVDDVVLTAERLADNGLWEPAQIYWDPIDGIGVLGGNQNDEIDVDERLTVKFASERVVNGSWLSDIFIGEATRYLGTPFTPEDVEIADIEIFAGDASLTQVRLNGVVELPKDPFGEELTQVLIEDGDLLNRILVEEEEISIYMPDFDRRGVIVLPLGEIDREKLSIFAGVEVVDIDIQELLGGAREITVFAVGSLNAQRILAMRDQTRDLEALRLEAENVRRVGDVSNGELGWYPEESFSADRITFTAGLQTSSDYSVAGITFGAREQ